jgi:hypothetical protein
MQLEVPKKKNVFVMINVGFAKQEASVMTFYILKYTMNQLTPMLRILSIYFRLMKVTSR